MTGKSVYVCTDYHEKQLQRALLQYSKPDNANLVREALAVAGREDLIGNSSDCLVRPAFAYGRSNRVEEKKVSRNSKNVKKKNGNVNKTSRSPVAVSRKTNNGKVERIFGSEAGRIRREAEKMSSSATKKRTVSKSSRANTAKKKK